MGDILDIMLLESNEKIDGKDFLNVMNRFADEISKVNSNMQKMWQDVNSKMDKMAIDIEKRLTNKMGSNIDKRVNAEAVKLKKEINKKIDDVRDDLCEDVKCLQQQIDEMPSKLNGSEADTDRTLNICIRNHPQAERENVSSIVWDLLRDGLKLRDMGFKKAIRKDRDDHKPGVIIVTCEKAEDKALIMRKKKQLKNCKKYEKVYIHADQSIETRVNNSNMKLLISALGVTGLKMKGSRLVAGNSNNNEDDSYRQRDRAESSPGDSSSQNREREQGHYRRGDSGGRCYNSNDSERRGAPRRGEGSNSRSTDKQYQGHIQSENNRSDLNNYNHSRSRRHEQTFTRRQGARYIKDRRDSRRGTYYN